MAREPEPLERVRALVCEPCWENCFDTEGFEKLGRGDIAEFKYNITGESLRTGTRTGCTWCLMVKQLFPEFEMTGNTYEIGLNSLNTVPDVVITPPGSNFYGFRIMDDELHRFSQFAELEFFTEHDNIAAQQVTARDVDRNVTPSKTFPQISSWLAECVQHSCCPQQIDSPLPTGLIDVATLKICHTNGAVGKFVALSYCWGTGSQIQLRSGTIETLMQHLNFDVLPQTIKDAVLVTRSLSIPYLWVDALCIIQDDVEDKAREIGSMAQIYSDAYITILASNAADAAHGFLAHRDTIYAPSARIPFRIAPNRFGSITARPYLHRSLSVMSDNSLSRRAWTLQEHMMASRILAYTKHTLEWQCASSMMSLSDSLNVGSRFGPVPKLISQLDTDPEIALREWSHTLEDYSHRSMSIQSDKLPAIAALAERFAAVLGQYHAGLWRYGLIRQLCWMSKQPRTECRGDLYRAPSWSWASAGPINLSLVGDDCCSLVSVKVLPRNAEVPFGEVVHASVKIYGKIIIASIAVTPREDLFGDNRMVTLIHDDSGMTEPPLRRFYKTYFDQATKIVDSSRRSVARATFFWDYQEFSSDPLTVLLLVLRDHWSDVNDDREAICDGLVLVPAGPGIARRIGTFVGLHRREIEYLVEHEITIV